jgi:hypothetical protein
MHTPEEICAVLRGVQFHFSYEKELQDGIAQRLTAIGIAFLREVILSRGDRIDFLVDRIGIEVKVDGSLSQVVRQLWRYAQRPEISALILVTSRAKHDPIPPLINGKSVFCVHLLSL